MIGKTVYHMKTGKVLGRITKIDDDVVYVENKFNQEIIFNFNDILFDKFDASQISISYDKKNKRKNKKIKIDTNRLWLVNLAGFLYIFSNLFVPFISFYYVNKLHMLLENNSSLINHIISMDMIIKLLYIVAGITLFYSILGIFLGINLVRLKKWAWTSGLVFNFIGFLVFLYSFIIKFYFIIPVSMLVSCLVSFFIILIMFIKIRNEF